MCTILMCPLLGWGAPLSMYMVLGRLVQWIMRARGPFPTVDHVTKDSIWRRPQNSGPWAPWLPVVKNSRLFAQRAHSARGAPIGRGRFLALSILHMVRHLLLHRVPI